jgi:hypothetical protein
VAHPLVNTELSDDIDADDTTIPLDSTVGMGPGYYRIGNEVLRCEVASLTAMDCTRGVEGTAAVAHAEDAVFQTRISVRYVNTHPVKVFPSERAAKNRVRYYRHALRLVNGQSPNLPDPGFTVAAENAVYVLGNYNANGTANFADPHSHAAVMGDVVTLLSQNWINNGDERSFRFPHLMAGRPASTSWYRMAIASGKGRTFVKPTMEPNGGFFGTDGGAHNFLRYLENWTSQTSYYRGSIVSLYYAHQNVGPFKCCVTVYSPPTRQYGFDLEFLIPSQLPPGTPRFRDINNLSFRQTIRADSD